jgi:hypothetical protein
VAYHTFAHVLDLDISFHLERRTGALSRVRRAAGPAVSFDAHVLSSAVCFILFTCFHASALFKAHSDHAGAGARDALNRCHVQSHRVHIHPDCHRAGEPMYDGSELMRCVSQHCWGRCPTVHCVVWRSHMPPPP